jgi:hypothetical protein
MNEVDIMLEDLSSSKEKDNLIEEKVHFVQKSSEAFSADNLIENSKNYYYGFGGWLVLVAIGLIFTFGNALYYLIDTLIPLYQNDQIQLLTEKYPNYNHLVYLESFMYLMYIILPLYIGFLCWKQKKLFTTMMIVYLMINPVFNIIHHYVMTTISILSTDKLIAQENTSLIRSILSGFIWISYFLRSKRVRNTYVNS